ncbi:phosphatase PAP2 family protein [Asanoa sp. WMMD1127]|uniref:phosphatase PAP2 family protein n=1 Tax=Asanoa sp. WMMD1127 TaxID=3016107 RepID=UPI002416D0BE|nr:phosphatase PAP2 family protein [Asanoa sp. WMMD1127]MDG4826581.1 phosphatase PAP2 family protein [Asanoa sp. WMMD1127]
MNPRLSNASRPLALAVAAAVAFGLAWLLFVRTAPGQWLDGELLPPMRWGGRYMQGTTLLGPAELVLKRFGNPLLLGLVVVATAVVGLLRRRAWSAVAAAAVFVCSVGAAGLIKEMLERPELGVETSTTHNSFPSGHVAGAAALLMGFLLVAPPRLRWWIAVPGTTGVSVIGAATMILGWHRFSDVVGSLLLVATVFCLAAAALTRAPDRTPAAHDEENDAVTGTLLQAIALTLLIMLVLALAPDAGIRLMLATAAVGVLTLLVVTGSVWLLNPPSPPDDEVATTRSAAASAGSPTGGRP